MTDRESAGRIRGVLAASNEILAFKGFVTEIETVYPVPLERLILSFTLRTGDTTYKVSLRNHKPLSLEKGHVVWVAGVQDASGVIEPKAIVNIDRRIVMLPYGVPPNAESLARALQRLRWALLAMYALAMFVLWPEVLYNVMSLLYTTIGFLLLVGLLPYSIVGYVIRRHRARLVRCSDEDWLQLLKFIQGSGVSGWGEGTVPSSQ